MKRKIYDNLLAWKGNEFRKPLVLQGARQVGKTFTVNEFGASEYLNVVNCNFEKEEGIGSLFDSLDPHDIIAKLQAFKKREIFPKHTLLIFDEIQACPRALTSLKYFCEEANDYHIVALGSLLGVSLKERDTSFPVGKVDFLGMYPLDFEEFLLAFDENGLVEEIRKCFLSDAPMPSILHEKSLKLYRQYLLLGGMPEVIDKYSRMHNYELAKIDQLGIIDSYLGDMPKYNKASEVEKTRRLYRSLATQLAKENRKFKYSLVKEGGRASEFAHAAEWLCLAGVAHRLFRLDQIKIPLSSYQDEGDFKFYMSDVGLLAARLNLLPNDILFDNEEMDDFKGGLVENYVYNQLLSNGKECFYWTSENSAEVDFITRIGEDIIPIEVKSGDNVRSKSLNVYMKRFNPKYSIRISMRNFGFENNIKSVPLYAAFCIK